jgi:hypothetical protein
VAVLEQPKVVRPFAFGRAQRRVRVGRQPQQLGEGLVGANGRGLRIEGDSDADRQHVEQRLELVHAAQQFAIHPGELQPLCFRGAARLLEIRPHGDVRERERRGVRQGFEHRDLLGRGLVLGGPVGSDRRDGLLLTHRHHQQAADEGRTIGVVRDAVILIDVGDRDRAPMLHDPSGDAGAHRKAPAFPQRRDRVLVGVEAVVTLAQDEGDAIGTGEPARRGPDDLGSPAEVAAEGQVADDGQEIALEGAPIPGVAGHVQRILADRLQFQFPASSG